MEAKCEICQAPAVALLNKCIDKFSISSDSTITKTNSSSLFHCPSCRYFMTKTQFLSSDFYRDSYSLLLSSFFEDQKIFGSAYSGSARNFYQAHILTQLFKHYDFRSALDLGAGKGLTSYHYLQRNPRVELTLYDPGFDTYEEYWSHYLPQASRASNLSKISSKFDLIYSFFALEHITDPDEYFHSAFSLLNPDGVFIGCAPDLSRNLGDLIVSDHLRHLDLRTLQMLVDRALSIDTAFHGKVFRDDALRAVFFIFSSNKDLLNSVSHGLDCTVNDNHISTESVLSVWPASRRAMLLNNIGDRKLLLWGSSFYAKLLDLSLDYPIHRVVDSNVDYQGKHFESVSGNRIVIEPPSEIFPLNASTEVLIPCMSGHAAEALLSSFDDNSMRASLLVF